MDVNDVTSNDDVAKIFRETHQESERALRRKGKLVRGHPPAYRLISGFMMDLLESPAQLQSPGWGQATLQLPPPYAPCVRAITELQQIAISDMRLETQHRGHKTLLRVRTPPKREAAVMAVAEDENGTAVLLQLFHQPPESVVPANHILRLDGVYIIKEPFFKCATDGSYTMRVDHPGDIVRLERTDEGIPLNWRQAALMPMETSKNIRIKGNIAAERERWSEASLLYSSAIQAAETIDDRRMAYLNRSLCNIKLERPEQALLDARQGINVYLPSEMGLFREARALYDLGDFSDSLERLQILSTSYPNNKSVKHELGRTIDRLYEQQTGEYNFHQMYIQAEKTPPLIDCATFSAPVEVRESPGRGRGLFTKVPVVAGQLLVCEKAFAYSFVDDNMPSEMVILMNMATKTAVMGGQASLLTKLVQKLYHSPRALQAYNELHHGNYVAPSVSEVDGRPVVDSFLVERIMALNSFGAPRTSRASLSESIAASEVSKKSCGVGYITCGIWLLASRINHSCIGNCMRSFIGDMQIIRAQKDLEAGTELTFEYRTPQLLESYDDAQKPLRSWGFTAILEDTRIALKGLPGAVNLSGVTRLLAEIDKTYPTTVPNVIKRELWDPYFSLGSALLSEGLPDQAIQMFVRGLETLGFKIRIAVPSEDSSALPELKVMHWGSTNDFTHWAFFHMYMAFERVAPQICATVRRYVEVSYSICD
ncbi:hypothetical protein ACHAQA_007241 [Verticillium albo-atrum]